MGGFTVEERGGSAGRFEGLRAGYIPVLVRRVTIGLPSHFDGHSACSLTVPVHQGVSRTRYSRCTGGHHRVWTRAAPEG